MALLISSEQQITTNFVHAYDLAGQRVYSQKPVALIEMFKVDLQPTEGLPYFNDSKLLMEAFDINSAKLVYQGEGSFSGGMKQVCVWESNNVQLLKVGSTNFSLTNLSTGHIRLLSDHQVDQKESAEILLGPPLLALLAKQSIFCLHAGAAETEYGSIIFIGESGRGKSTLSQSVSKLDWQQLGDDIMPVSFYKGDAQLIPRFPQLKRKHQHMEYLDKPLAAIFRLLEPSHNHQIEFQAITGSKAVISLARHTAASKVFSEEMLMVNMAFNKKIASTVPIYNISYPRDYARLDDVRAEIIKKMIQC